MRMPAVGVRWHFISGSEEVDNNTFSCLHPLISGHLATGSSQFSSFSPALSIYVEGVGTCLPSILHIYINEYINLVIFV